MKKLFSVLAALCLVFAVAGNAAADFEYGANSSLTLSIYNESLNTETGYDLGILGVDFTLADQERFMGTVDVSDLGADAALYTATSNWQTFVGTSVDTAPVISTSGIITQQGASRDIWNTYNSLVGSSPATIAGTDAGGKTATGYFANGSYAGFVIGNSGMASVAELAIDGYFDIFLYQYDSGVLNTGFDAGTDYAAKLRIFDTGSVVLNGDIDPNPVPVPAAVWLLGSGLLGLIGIRRRNA